MLRTIETVQDASKSIERIKISLCELVYLPIGISRPNMIKYYNMPIILCTLENLFYPEKSGFWKDGQYR